MSAPPPLPTQGLRKRILPLCIVLVILAPFLAALGYYLVFRISTARAIDRLEARAKAKGEPLTLGQLAATHRPIPEEENAATPLLDLWEKEDPIFWQAFRSGQRPLPERLQKKDFERALLPIVGRGNPRLSRSGPLPPDTRAAAETHVQEKKDHMEAVRAALAWPRCRFPIQITEGYNAVLPHLAELRGEAQNFRIQGALDRDTRNVDGSLRALEDTARCGQVLAGDPFLISQLFRVSCASMVLQDTERLLSRGSLSVAQLDRLQNLIGALEMKDALRTALVSERASALSVFDPSADTLAQAFPQPGDGSLPAERRKLQVGMGVIMATGLGGADHRFMLETMEEAIALAGDESPAATEKWEQWDTRLAEESAKFPPKLFSRMLLPALSRAWARFTTFEARRRATLSAIAVERYRSSHNGQLPEKLADLAPGFLERTPIDPFDGQPLRFKRLEKGFVIYSVGANRRDDGGKERPEKVGPKDYDETFSVER
jgi:hypothetical protein